MNFEVIPTPDFERSFKPLAKRHRSLKALEEARTGQTVDPFHTTQELMEDLLN